MAFGFKAEEIIPMLTNLGDAASGLGLGTEGVSRLAYALGQMQTSGKLNAAGHDAAYQRRYCGMGYAGAGCW